MTAPRPARFARRFRTLAALAAVLNAAPLARAAAQSVVGAGPDATLVPRGTVRLDVGSDWTYADERFAGPATTGTTEPLGAALSLGTIGVAQLPGLAPTQSALRVLTGTPAYTLSLGELNVSESQRVQTTRFALVAGLTRWLQLELAVPLVRTRENVVVRGNATGREGDLGANPALNGGSAFVDDTSFSNQLVRAGAAVARYCAGAGAGSGACASAGTLATDAQQFGTALGTVYAQSAYVPVTRSATEKTINSRAADLRARLNAFASTAGSGVPSVTATGVVGATPLAAPDLQAALSDSLRGPGIAPLGTVEHLHLGNVEIGATVRLLDTFGGGADRRTPTGAGLRVTAGAAYRLPTGERTNPLDVADLPAGTHAGAAVVHAAADLLAGPHFWTSVAAQLVKFQSDQTTVRAVSAGNAAGPYAPATLTAASYTPGALRELDVTPRWGVGDFLSFAGRFRYAHADADSYTGGVVPAVVGGGGAWTAEQVGGAIAFSNVRASVEGRTHLPIDVVYEHLETIRGANVAKVISDQIMIRVYAPLSWRRAARRPRTRTG